jgi:hypothetical protein
MTGSRSRQVGSLLAIIALATAGCGGGMSGPGATAARAGSLPPGVMSAVRACRQVVGRSSPGLHFTGVQRVHLVLTRYAQGEPVESQGDISSGMPPRTRVWVVEVHARAIHWDHSVPPEYHAPARPDTDFSVVMNARTGVVSDSGESNDWPLPLSTAGTVVSLPPQC